MSQRRLMKEAKTWTVRHVTNPHVKSKYSAYPFKHLVSQEGNERAVQTLKYHFREAFRKTSELRIPSELFDVKSITLKNETNRLGLSSFKALGGSLVVSDLAKNESKPTIVTASAGNHGIGVAFSAQKFNCPCIVYLPESVPESQADRVRAYGAEVKRVSGNYEVALQTCRDDAAASHDYEIVQDVSWDNYEAVPRRIWEGYATIAAEILDDSEKPPTHVFVNAGVGGLATGLCGYMWDRLGPSRPRFVTVEPDQADCIMQSVIRGEPVTVTPQGTTCQVGLDCKRPDPIAFEVLLQGTNDTISIPDQAVQPAMDFLRHSSIGLEAGESGVAGMAALMHICQDDTLRSNLEIDSDSRVCVVICEGAIQ